MADNFFTDNPDLARYLAKIDLSEVVEVLEDGYRYHAEYSDAPRGYTDAVDNYRLLLTLLGDICANRVAPRAAEAADEGVRCDDNEVVYAAATQEALAVLRQADLMGAMLPREYGGLNLPETVYQMMIELVSRAEAGMMTIFGLQEISATIAEYGDVAMKDRFLPRFARGEVTGAMVLTEPDAGSDLGAVQTRATYDEAAGVWRLNGVKRFITNGGADVMLVLARSEAASADARGLSMFAIEADESVRVRRLEHKMGLSASPTAEIEFVETPALLLGKQRFGLIRYAMSMMNGARIAVSAQALGIAEAAYREAEKYAAKRIQFGQPINVIPAVYRMLLAMRCDLEATRALIYETGRWVDLKKVYERRKEQGDFGPEGRERLKQADHLSAVLTPLAKYYATEMGNRVCYQAMQIHGGAGYMREFNVERHYRDVRVTSIYEGTSQLQVVAATGGLLAHSLDTLLDNWSAEDYGPDLTEIKEQAQAATDLLNAAIDRLHDQERPIINYYAGDLADLAVNVIMGWLMLQDGRSGERKRELARLYFADRMPQMHGWAERIQALDPTPIAARDLILAG
jgi:3-(methylthio)propanoyl-CoA dehydrogenase